LGSPLLQELALPRVTETSESPQERQEPVGQLEQLVAGVVEAVPRKQVQQQQVQVVLQERVQLPLLARHPLLAHPR
jgi:predicted methyltransferase MtxX (methanogen marker protein 4)